MIGDALAYATAAEADLLAAVQAGHIMFHVRPPGEEWSVADVLAHLIRTERVYQLIWLLAAPLGRFPRLLEVLDKLDIRMWRALGLRTLEEAPGVRLVPANARQGKFAAPELLKPASRRTMEQMLSLRRRVRAQSLRIIGRLTEKQLHGVRWSHPLFGKYTMLEWVEMMGSHDRRHTAQIERILAAIGVGLE